MPAIIVYLLKVILCSGILFLYYRIALYNKQFHQWNRFYLLMAVLMSMVVPVLQFRILPASSPEPHDRIIHLLNIVGSANAYHDESASSGETITLSSAGSFVYMMISLVLLLFLFYALGKIWKLVRRHGVQKMQEFNLVPTHEKDAPFSFFRYIFWNENIDMRSVAGSKILLHEMTHVREMHSADRLFMNVVTIFFWCNPFYWLIRRELSLVHEFIADKETIADADTSEFSSMILLATFPRNEFGITSNFSSSSIKRRLLMLNQSANPKAAYYSRMLLLPVIVLILAAFTLNKKQVNSEFPTGAAAIAGHGKTRPFTVVIDAGHGGTDMGAVAGDGTEEKNIVLAIVQKIRQQNTNKNIVVKFTREQDIFQGPRDRVNYSVSEKPDAFISLHVNSLDSAQSGFNLFVAKKKSAYMSQAVLMGTLLFQEIQKIYPVAPDLTIRVGKNIWVLDAPDINYPALLIECGNMSNRRDLSFITDPTNQDQVAEHILRAIELYAAQKVN